MSDTRSGNRSLKFLAYFSVVSYLLHDSFRTWQTNFIATKKESILEDMALDLWLLKTIFDCSSNVRTLLHNGIEDSQDARFLQLEGE